VIQEGRDGLSDADWSKDTRSEERIAAEAVVENVLRAGDVGMDPGDVRQLFQGKGGDGTFVALADPFEGKVVAIGIEGVWGRESVETGLGEAPQECVRFEVEGGTLTVSVRPSFRPPCDVETAGVVVGDGVGETGWCELDGGLGR
jgi:hypothetical protein